MTKPPSSSGSSSQQSSSKSGATGETETSSAGIYGGVAGAFIALTFFVALCAYRIKQARSQKELEAKENALYGGGGGGGGPGVEMATRRSSGVYVDAIYSEYRDSQGVAALASAASSSSRPSFYSPSSLQSQKHSQAGRASLSPFAAAARPSFAQANPAPRGSIAAAARPSVVGGQPRRPTLAPGHALRAKSPPMN